MYDVTSIQNLKKDVLYFVAKASFEGTLEEERDLIPEKMIEGPEPTFRCCIYKEREIVRQRIRLAEGKAPGAEDDGNIVQVIKSACADCPISSYVVTNNCQNCLGKDCIKACRFGAIEPESILRNVRNVVCAQKPVHTMRSLMYQDHVKTAVQ